MTFKVGDTVKTSCDDTQFDNLIGTIIAIDEGWEGQGTIKVLFDVLYSYNPITDRVLTHHDQVIRFNPSELRVIRGPQ